MQALLVLFLQQEVQCKYTHHVLLHINVTRMHEVVSYREVHLYS